MRAGALCRCGSSNAGITGRKSVPDFNIDLWKCRTNGNIHCIIDDCHCDVNRELGGPKPRLDLLTILWCTCGLKTGFEANDR